MNEIVKYLNGDIKIIDTYYDNISPCLDCRFCWNNDGCCIDDQMQEVYKLLNQVDNIIISSPLYFSELSGKLLSFASRLQTFYVRRYIRKDREFKLKEKRGILIITGGGDGSPEPAIERADIIFRHMNAHKVGTILSLQTEKLDVKEDKNAMSTAKNIALQLNKTSTI
ncbi:MAG: NAD(P)H-dependent oxidoreductase [Vallitalea sp.]|nr:NAD(P)H-dependent oxidoreductase [Vallitalea sp.]